MMKKRLLIAALAAGLALPALATDLRLATWNLGWHMDMALARNWMAQCGRPFAPSAKDQRWAPAAEGPSTGWQLQWGREAPIDWDIGTLPPCNVYQVRGQILPVTEPMYAQRQRQIAEVLGRQVDADVIAFQEVSGRQSVLEVLPGGGADYEVCSYEGHKVQRLAIAWRKRLGPAVSCEAYWPLSLPQAPAKDQPRPGLALTLKVDGKLLRLMTLHLKSSCVTPLEDPRPDGRGQLDGQEPNCLVLQQQVPALEAWLEAQSVGVDALVMLGDFNRDLAHEAGEPASAAVRSDGKASDPHRPGNRVRNLWREVNDGVPAASALTLLDVACPGSDAVRDLCSVARTRRLARDEYGRLGGLGGLGCRNPIGLDHIAVAGNVKAGVAQKVALGDLGPAAPASEARPLATLGTSDHCPLTAVLSW